MDKIVKYDVSTIAQQYREAIDVTPEDRKDLMKLGQLETASARLGMDKMLKENYLLQIAMQDPKGYIQKRTAMMEKIKKDVDKHFVEVYEKFSKDDENKLPPAQAKELAMRASAELMQTELMRLEAIYPSEFGKTAYNREINNQLAKRTLEFSGEK